MNALMKLAEQLGIDPGPLNQTELQEQTCSAALTQIMELAAQVERLRDCVDGLISRTIGVQDGWDILKETQPTALAALKAQWQAEGAMAAWFELKRMGMAQAGSINVIKSLVINLRQRAQETGDANHNNPPA